MRQKKPKTKVPDAIVYHEGDKFLVEVERTLKKNSYYERVFESLSYDYPDVEAVLYFTDGLPMIKHLQKLADGCKQIFFCAIRDFLEYECESEFRNYKEDWLILQCHRFSHPNKKNMDESLWDYWSEEFPEEVSERKSA